MGRISLGLLKREHNILAFEVQCPGKYMNHIWGKNLGAFHIFQKTRKLTMTFWVNLKHIWSLVGGESFRENYGGELEIVHWKDDIHIVQKIIGGTKRWTLQA